MGQEETRCEREGSTTEQDSPKHGGVWQEDRRGEQNKTGPDLAAMGGAEQVEENTTEAANTNEQDRTNQGRVGQEETDSDTGWVGFTQTINTTC